MFSYYSSDQEQKVSYIIFFSWYHKKKNAVVNQRKRLNQTSESKSNFQKDSFIIIVENDQRNYLKIIKAFKIKQYLLKELKYFFLSFYIKI